MAQPSWTDALVAFLGETRKLIWANLATGQVCYKERGKKRYGWLR